MISQWESNDQLWEIYQLAQGCLFDSIGSFGLDAGSLSVSIYNLSVGDMDFAMLNKTNSIQISSVGVEPWIAPVVLPDRSSKVIGISKELPTRFEDDHIRLIWDILKFIGLEIQSYLHQYSSGISLVTILPPGRFPLRKLLKRRDHQYRLVGMYSTAQLKYSQICACLELSGSKDQ